MHTWERNLLAWGGSGCYSHIIMKNVEEHLMDNQKEAGAHTIYRIATIRTEFAEKFGVPRQSGLVEGLRGEIVFEPAYRNAEALRASRNFRICGCYGDFPGIRERDLRRLCIRRVWAERKRKACSRRGRRSARTQSGSPASG